MGVACYYGIGNHILDIHPPEAIFEGLKYVWMGLILGIPVVVFAKFGIVALLFQVTSVNQRRRRIMLWSIAAFYSVVNIAQIIVTLTQCEPYNKLWFKALPGSCPRATFANNFGIFQGSVAVAMDFFLAFYPITIVWDLQITPRAKLGFCVLMAGGVLCVLPIEIRISC